MPTVSRPRSFLLAALGAAALLAAASPAARAQVPDFRTMTPAQRQAFMDSIRAGSERDRDRMVAQLHLPAPPALPPAAGDPNRPPNTFQRANAPGNNWYDSAGNTYVRSEWGNWSNYDEARAGEYRLPDPLVTGRGRRVSDSTTWWRVRRPEILELVSREIYGRIPAHTPPVHFEVTQVDSARYPGEAVVKRVTGRIDNSAYPAAKPRIDITLYLPPHVTRPVPVMMVVWGAFFGFGPQDTTKLPDRIAQVLAQGWAFGTVNTTAIQADNGAGLDEGIIGLVSRGRPRKPDDWGVLAAWSWGMSRALDYLETDPEIDAKRAAIEGHSRWGKTALLAGALDRRWAIVWASSSGAMGASLEKRNWGETIDNVAASGEYHWMAGNFLKYAGHWAAMPVDAHDLIALVAPRPLFVTGGTRGDTWVDTHGEFLAAVAAESVYRLLGARGLGTSQMPAADQGLMDGELAFRMHEGGHTDMLDWPVFLQWARRYFAPTAPPQGGPGAPPAEMRRAFQLDLADSTAQARAVFQGVIDTATDPAARAAARRAMAISWAFDGDCANTARYETMVIAYWATREPAEPQNAFYQEGEMADEAARVCLDAGDLAAAEQWYRRGNELGLEEPAPPTHPRSLWAFRLAHALGRIAARRGDSAEARRQISAARGILDGDSAMAAQQERFFPYLTGYVALYGGDPATAERELTRAVAMPGNQRDPFMLCLLAMAEERLGKSVEARAAYRQAWDLATAHNPPAAFVRPYVRRKLGLP